MKATAQIENPEEVEVTMTITMPLGRWKQLDKQLSEGKPWIYPASDLVDRIRDTKRSIEEKVYLDIKKDPKA